MNEPNRMALTRDARPLWWLGEVIEAVGARVLGDARPETPVTGISIDTRTLQPGDLFVAIVGDRVDGHDYLAAAFHAGAAAAVVHRLTDQVPAGAPLLAVDDTLRGLEALGRAARARCPGTIMAITGSVGKTGTKDMLGAALRAIAPTHAAVKSFNNHWGVPLTLARMPRNTAFGVFEIGMNHAGEIRALVDMVRPHGALITTVEPVHLEFFNDVGEIADAKSEIFEGLMPGGVAVINADNPHAARMHGAARAAGARTIVHFGASVAHDAPDPQGRVRLVDHRDTAVGSRALVDVDGRLVDLSVNVPGRHVVQNLMGVLGLVSALGINPQSVADGFGSVMPGAGRGRRQTIMLPAGAHHGGGKALIIDESYNANPASMRAAIEGLATVPRADFPRRIAVLGDMRELGATSDDLHRELAAPLIAAGVDLVMSAGPHMAHLMQALPASMRGGHASSAEGLRDHLLASVRPGDALMFKGSLASGIGPLVEAVLACDATQATASRNTRPLASA